MERIMTDIAITSPIVRIARVLVAYKLSPNAGGAAELDEVVSAEVDERMEDELLRAAAIFRTLREPTQEMVDAGNAVQGDAAEVWNVMVRAALHDQKKVRSGAAVSPMAPSSGSDMTGGLLP